ncbi:MAG: nucleotidyltransferase family protein [Thermoleophilaceae bacterium]
MPDTLLLRAALLDGDLALDAWREWRGSRDLGDMAVPALRLVPLLFRNLPSGGIDEADLARLKEIYLSSWTRSRRLLARGGEALTTLAGAGIETMVLKGAALASLYYPDPGTRPMVDFDVLVRTREATRALDALERAGWRPVEALSRPQALAGRHSTPLAGPDGFRVDLHWRALDPAARDDDFWEAARRTEVAGVETLAPGPAEQLLHVCAHGVGASPAGPRWVADAVTVVRRSGDGLDWDRFAERAAARRLTLALRPALGYLRSGFGVPVPAGTLVQLERRPTTTTERLLHRAAWRMTGRRAFAAMSLDSYRRLRGAEHDSPVPRGYLSFLAAHLGFASRARMLAHFARRTLRH